MANDDFEVITEETTDNQQATDSQQAITDYLNSDFLLLLIILFIFFQKTESFSNHLQTLNDYVSQMRNYLDTADSTLQALDQASQIPKQKLNDL
ncbi:hypothetical protein [Halanaerobaculum tunisiense]